MTEFLFRDDAYLRSTEARIVAITQEGGIVLDRTRSTRPPADSPATAAH